jgi:hypothetical protein
MVAPVPTMTTVLGIGIAHAIHRTFGVLHLQLPGDELVAQILFKHRLSFVSSASLISSVVLMASRCRFLHDSSMSTAFVQIDS